MIIYPCHNISATLANLGWQSDYLYLVYTIESIASHAGEPKYKHDTDGEFELPDI